MPDDTATNSHSYEDGNCLAGPLAELFTVDVTAAVFRCAGCARTDAVATLHVYHHAPGLVARCPGCQHVVLRLVRSPDAAWLDLTGTTALRIRLPA
jgi:hypothetical protein